MRHHCGTPVITYNTGGSPEAIDEKTGIVVKQGDIIGLGKAINIIISSKNNYSRKYAEEEQKNFITKMTGSRIT